MEKEKTSFIVRKKYQKQIEMLDNEKAGMLLKAMFKKQNGEVLENIEPTVSMLLSIMEEERKKDEETYQKVCEKNRENVLKRWNTNKNEGIQKDATVYDRIPTDTKNTDYDSDSDKDNDSDNNNATVIEKEIREDGKRKFLENVWLEEKEYSKLLNDYNKKDIDDYMNRLNYYIDNHGDRYTSHYKTLLAWMRKDMVKKKVIKPLSTDTGLGLIQIKR